MLRNPRALPPLAEELPHSLCVDAEQGVLLLQTRRTPVLMPRLSLGCAWEMEPVNIDVTDESACLSLARQYESLITGLPVGSTLQFLMTIFPSHRAPRWSALRDTLAPSPLIDAQRAAIATGLPHGTGAQRGRLRHFQTLVTVRVPLVEADAGLLPTLEKLLALPEHYGASALGKLRHHLHASEEVMSATCAGVEDLLVSCGHRLARLNSTGLGLTLGQHLNALGEEKTAAPLIVEDLPLRDQVFRGEAETYPGGWCYGTSDEHGQFHETHGCQVLSLHHLGRETYPGMLSAARTPVGDDGKPMRPIAFWNASDQPLSLVVNIAAAPPLQEERRLRWKSNTAKIQALFRVENAAIQEELDKLVKQMFLTGETVHWARIHAVVWGEAARLRRAVNRVKQAARRWSLAFEEEPDLGSTLFLQALPLGCDQGWPHAMTIQRERRMPRQNLTHFLPVLGSTRGTQTASIFALNERGEEVGFDPFDSDTNAHMLISGTSGAGKTYATNLILHYLVARGGIGIVLDPLANYRALNAAHHGLYYKLGFTNPPRINPFLGPMDQEHRTFLMALLGEMASGSGRTLAWNASNVLSQALAFHAQRWNFAAGETWLGAFVRDTLEPADFANKERETRRLAKELVLNLSQFYGDGPFAPFFDGVNTFRFSDTLTGIEMEGLEKSKDLQAIWFFAMLNNVTQFYKEGQRKLLPKYLVADELWSALKHAQSADVVETIVRTFRNIRTSTIFCSNQAEDFGSAVGKVVANLTDLKLILKQARSELPDIIRIFNLSPAEALQVEQAQKYERHSTAYLRLDKGQGGLIRLLGDPLLEALVSQAPAAVERRDRYITAADGDYERGIQALVAHYQEDARG